MTNRKDIFLNQNIRCGGFYELSIQVCQSNDNRPIENYTNFIWTKDNVSGPYDDNFRQVDINNENNQHQGILTLSDFSIPFKTFSTCEQNPIETGYNWFDISFYTATLDYAFALDNTHWSEKDTCPAILKAFLLDTLKALYSIYPFLLATIDFEISGQYYLDNLKDGLDNWTNSEFYVGKINYDSIKNDYKKYVTVID